MKITGPWTAAAKKHVGPVNFLYMMMFEIRKIKPNSGSGRQNPKSFHGDYMPVRPIKFNSYYRTQWISKLAINFEIRWVRQYLVNVFLFGVKDP